MRENVVRSVKAFVFVTLGGCLVLVHALLSASSWSKAAAMGGALQLSILAALVLARSAQRFKWWIALGVTLLFVLAALQSGENSLLAVPGIPHAIAYFLLLLLFGTSLRPGREAFITAGVRKIQDPLPANLVAYTRNVTWAWCCFFVGQLTVSLVLLLYLSDEAWSFFVSYLNLPLVALMFAGEYAYRVAYVPNRPRATMSAVIRAFAYTGAEPATNAGAHRDGAS
jgi:uncharacterized membrane protein